MYWFNPIFPNIYLSGGAVGKKSVNKLAKRENEITFQNVFANLVLTALHRYKLEGDIPKTISPRVFMQSLLWYGTVVLYKDGDSWLALSGVPDGSGINLYGDFAGAFVFGANGYNKRVPLYMRGAYDSGVIAETIAETNADVPRGVLIRENPIMYPFVNICMQYASWIADAYRTLDVCRMHLKHPYVISCEESEVNTVKEWFKQTSDNSPAIVSTGIFPADKVKVQDINTPPNVVTNITSLIEWYKSGFKALCGIEHNSQADKKGENLLLDEVGIDSEWDNMSLDRCIDTINRSLEDAEKIGAPHLRVSPTVQGKIEELNNE